MWTKLVGISVGAGAVVGVIVTGFVEWSAAGVLVAAVSGAFAALLLAKLLMPRITRGELQKNRDRGGETPPTDSQPVTSPLVTAWADALNAGDFDTAGRMLDSGFACECPQIGKTFPRAKYLQGLKKTRRQFPQMRYTVHEVREAAGELWVRAATYLEPRRGDPIATQSWEAWRVDGDQILGMRQGKVLDVTGPGRA